MDISCFHIAHYLLLVSLDSIIRKFIYHKRFVSELIRIIDRPHYISLGKLSRQRISRLELLSRLDFVLNRELIKDHSLV